MLQCRNDEEVEATKARHPNQVFLSFFTFHILLTAFILNKDKENADLNLLRFLFYFKMFSAFIFNKDKENADLNLLGFFFIMCSKPAQRRWERGCPEIVLLRGAGGDFILQSDQKLVRPGPG